MNLGQVVVAAAGTIAMVLGIWLLLKRQPSGDSVTSEARSPLVSFSGPPGLVLTLSGLLLIGFPFSPWWPATSTAAAPAPSPSTHVTAPSPSASATSSEPTVDVIKIEAERATTLIPSFEAASDAASSGGAYIQTHNWNDGTARFEFTASGGAYRFWGRVSMPDPGKENSFFVSVDSSEPDAWDFFEGEDIVVESWAWEPISLRCGGTDSRHFCDPLVLELAAGDHALVLTGREINARLDALIVTNDPDYVPSGPLT